MMIDRQTTLKYRSTIIGLSIVASLFFTSPVGAAVGHTERNALITSVKLNENLQQNVCGAELDEGGAIYLQTECITGMKIDTKGAQQEKDSNGVFFALKTFPGVTYTFDEHKLILALTVDPNRLPIQSIKDSSYAADGLRQSLLAGFLNWGVNSGLQNGKLNGTTLNNELGLNLGDWLFLSDGFAKTDGSGYTRQTSKIIHDDRNWLTRLTIGDTQTMGGTLGSSTMIGGMQLAKNYDIDPYQAGNTHPTFNLTGLAPLASDVDVYLNGQKIKTVHVDPGRFDLSGLQGYGGSSAFDVVIRDPYGNSTKTSSTFYMTDALLKAGLQDFNYSLGFTRPNYGQPGIDNYSSPLLILAHKMGFTDTVTAGFHAEMSKNVINSGFSAIAALGRFGVLTADVAASREENGFGKASQIGYAYSADGFSASFSGQAATQNYHIATEGVAAQRIKDTGTVSLSYGNTSLGSLSVTDSIGKYFDGSNFQRQILTYTRSLTRNALISASFFKNTQAGAVEMQGLVTLTFSPEASPILTAGVQLSNGAEINTLEASKGLQSGDNNYGYDLKASYTPKGSTTELQPELDYNARMFTLQAIGDFKKTNVGWNTTANINGAGAILFTSNTIAATRPISDSFAVVETGIPGINIYDNNNKIGKTDNTGKAIIPNLNAYTNQKISLGDDIPIQYLVTKNTTVISPSYRSGSRVCFPVTLLQSLTATLVTTNDKGQQEQLKTAAVTIQYNGVELSAQTGTDGELYLDNSNFTSSPITGTDLDGCSTIGKKTSSMRPGNYFGTTFDAKGTVYTFTLTIPAQEQPLLELGVIVCKPTLEVKP